MTVKIMLKKIRTERGLSQNQLARLADTSLQNIQKIEYGKTKGIQYGMLNKLCNILQCSPGDLLVWVPDDTSNIEKPTSKTPETQSSLMGQEVVENLDDHASRSYLQLIQKQEILESA